MGVAHVIVQSDGGGEAFVTVRLRTGNQFRFLRRRVRREESHVVLER